MMIKRIPGYYWVKHHDSLTVGHYTDEYYDNMWLLVGSEELIPESELVVGDKLDEPISF